MPVDVGGFDPLSVSMRDYVDGHLFSHNAQHTRQLAETEKLLDQKIGALSARIDALEAVYRENRVEDQAKVRVALDAVGAASAIHAVGHEQQHHAHQEIHGVEKENLTKASIALDKRLESMNGIRDQLRDQANAFMPREVAESQITDIRSRVELNAGRFTDFVTRENYDSTVREWTTWRTGVSATLSTMAGKATGTNTTIGIMLTIVGVVISLVVLIATGVFR